MAQLIDDPDKPGVQVVEDAWTRSNQAQVNRNNIYNRLWQSYKAYKLPADDPLRSNVSFPKYYSIIETIAPRLVRALLNRRPYIPIKSDKSPDEAAMIEKVLDAYLYMDNFKEKGAQSIKMQSTFGTSFLEPIPMIEEVTEKRVTTQQVFPFETIVEDVKVPRFRLKTRVWAPWQVFIEPNMLDLGSPGYAITVEWVARKEVDRLIESGRFKKPKTGELSSVSDSSFGAGGEDKNFGKLMLAGLGISQPAMTADYGILMRYMSEDRYITVWNGIDELDDGPNPFDHGRINLAKLISITDPMLQNSFWGQSEGKVIEGLLDKLDETYNIMFDNHDEINQGIYKYKQDAVQPEQIVSIGGARIEIRADFQGSLDDGLKRENGPGLPADFYNVPNALERQIDVATGVNDITRGEAGNEIDTATEASLLAAQGDLRSELRVSTLETGLADFAELATGIIDQFTAFDDRFEILGEEALSLATLNPKNLPGGFQYQFKGADSVSKDFQEMANFRNVINLISSSPVLVPGGWERKLLEKNNMSEEEIDEIIMNEEAMQIQQQQLAAQAQQDDQQQLVGDAQRAELGLGPQTRAARVPTAGNPGG